MQINSTKNNPNFKAVVFHNNAKRIITQGNSSVTRKVNKFVKELELSKDWDLHVLPIGNNDFLSYYWTKQGGQNRCMTTSIGTHFLKDNKVSIYAMNPSTYGDLADFSATLTYSTNEEAKKAYGLIHGSYNPNETLYDEFKRHAESTIAIEKAEKFDLRPFLGYHELINNMPKGEKFILPSEPKKNVEKVDIIPNITPTGKSVKYSFSDRLKILFGLQPKR